MKAIEESQIAVIIFSKNYANSTWCLDELTHIMKLREEGKQTVFPIFYDVEPTDVRKQKRTYKEAFDKHESESTFSKKIKSWGQAFLNDFQGWFSTPQKQPELENTVKVDSWRNALVEASSISGWETKQIANGHEAQGIKQIVDEISQRLVTLRANEDLVGMRTRVKGLKSELHLESGGVRMIGIWGVGGGGKTTLASFIYDEISSIYFETKAREEVRRVEEGQRMIRARLRHKKVLIVLDDVDHLDQLEALVGSRDWFGEGSRIIITTRDEHILNVHRVDVIHLINLLNIDEAVKLFRKHANREYTPMEDFEQLIKEVVRYASGLPLALKVLGSFLCDKDISMWRSALARLKKIPEDDILRKLRISFDGLKQVEKDLFLDIACFFRRMSKGWAMKMLDSCGSFSAIGIEVLRQKALITTSFEMFDMHDLVQEMAHYIVREKHPKNPEKHKRVWKTNDVRRILDIAATTELDKIEAIDFTSIGYDYEESQRFLQVAGNMNKLRWIDLCCSQPFNEERDGDIVPLPGNFPSPQLCFLNAYGCIPQKQLWEGYKYLPNLTHMELSILPNLIKIPDFFGLPKLETFKLYDCPCLEEIHPSIGSLGSLVFLSILCCRSLKMSSSIARIKKLETLLFNDCCLRDEELGSDFWDLPNLKKLNLCYNPLISRLDFRILRLPRLKCLDVSRCYRLVELSELPSNIAVVTADHCSSLESFGDISNYLALPHIQSLINKNIIKNKRMCFRWQGNASEDRFISVALHQHQVPNGIMGRLIRRNTFRLHLPDDWYNDFRGFLICISDVYERNIKITIKQEDPPFDLSHECDEVVDPIYDGQMTFGGYVSFSSLRHTKLLTSSYNIILVTMEHPDESDSDEMSSTYGGIELIPRKSRSDEMQTTDFSKIRDGKLHEELNTFTIQQYDSDSSIEITWRPLSNLQWL
ncbi:hypothetical protein LXL04_005578 [Taraxacum kok-saghyz]